MNLQKLKEKLSTNCKGSHISILSESNIAKRDFYLTSKIHDLNRIISGDLFKNIPEKTLSLFVGPEHSFKSSSACILMAQAQKEGYIPIVIDTEGAWTNEFIERWGGDPTNVIYIYEPWVDKVKVILAQLIEDKKEKPKKSKKQKKNEIIEEENDIIEEQEEDPKYFIILDSIGGMDKYKIVEDALAGEPKNDQGGLQKEIKPLMKMLLNISKTKNSFVVCTGHFYGSPGQYGNAEEIGGGKFVRLAPDIIVSYKKRKLFSGDFVIGSDIDAITLKNRFYPPFNEAKIQISYQDGINPYAGIIDIAIEAGLIEKGGAWFTYGKHKIQGMEKLQNLFKENEELSLELLNEINSWILKTGYSSINEEIKTIMEKEENDEVEEKINE